MIANPAIPFAPTAKAATQAPAVCHHCGQPCPPNPPAQAGLNFCCTGCLSVHNALNAAEACPLPANGVSRKVRREYQVLDDPEMLARLVQYQDDTVARAVLDLPAIHCATCIQTLEQLPHLLPGVSYAEVNFSRRQFTVAWRKDTLTLSQIATELHRRGYPPAISLATTDKPKRGASAETRRLMLHLGVAGFCFGNIMLLAFPEYTDPGTVEHQFERLFGFLSLGLAVPLFLYSGSSYLRSALATLRTGVFSIDLPLAIGMTTMFVRSAYEIISGTGMGYLDSLGGLIFFLLLGRLFQQKTYDFLSFERDYRSYFPLSVIRLSGTGAETVPVERLATDDRIWVRNGEVIPADAELISPQATLDNAFLTGESLPVTATQGQSIFAGARITGTPAELRVTRPVAHSSLAALWDQPAFRKPRDGAFTVLIDRISRYFTFSVVGIAAATLAFWLWKDPARAWDATTAVLIIACPCALAFAAPFTFGHLMRYFGRRGFYLKSTEALEQLASIDTWIFDKTGTLTENQAGAGQWTGNPPPPEHQRLIAALAALSTHPLSRALAAGATESETLPVTSFEEFPGKGVSGTVAGTPVRLGSAAFLGIENEEAGGVWAQVGNYEVPTPAGEATVVQYHWQPQASLRSGLESLLSEMKTAGHRTLLVSGDQPDAEAAFTPLFPAPGQMHFRQSPADKVARLEEQKADSHRVAMVGDGLNDAAALRQAHFGLAVMDSTAQFAPAADALVRADALPRLGLFQRVSLKGLRIVKICFAVSVIYNIIGTAFAVQGLLQPVVAAILMPFSSIGIILLSTALTVAMAKRQGVTVGAEG